VTGFGLANPKLYGEREQAKQMLERQPASTSRQRWPQLQGEQIRMLPLMVKFMMGAGLLSRDVLDECLERPDLGDPAKGPDIATMANRVDTATGSSIATSLYDRVSR
jgi:hypothetical protein